MTFSTKTKGRQDIKPQFKIFIAFGKRIFVVGLFWGLVFRQKSVIFCTFHGTAAEIALKCLRQISFGWFAHLQSHKLTSLPTHVVQTSVFIPGQFCDLRIAFHFSQSQGKTWRLSHIGVVGGQQVPVTSRFSLRNLLKGHSTSHANPSWITVENTHNDSRTQHKEYGRKHRLITFVSLICLDPLLERSSFYWDQLTLQMTKQMGR